MVPPTRFLVSWALGWAAVGGLVAAGITFTRGGIDLVPVLLVSVLFAEVVGFTALLSARVVFPLFTRLPAPVSLALQVLTLFSGTVFGSAAILMSQPLFSLARLRTVAMIVVVNAVLAVAVGIALRVYDSMRQQIEESYRALREKEAMEREIEIAREVQRELLPRSFPAIRGLELAGACHPAVGVGGDYYDFLQFSEDRLGLVIADVSGKGIPAGVLRAFTRSIVRHVAHCSGTPGETLVRVNGILYDARLDAMFVSLFLGWLDPATGRLRYANAGHPSPLRFAPGVPPRAFAAATGPILGILGLRAFATEEDRLERGESMLLYTDGVAEARNAAGRFLGTRPLAALLMRHASDNLDDLCGEVARAVDGFQGGRRHDDATILALRWLGAGAQA